MAHGYVAMADDDLAVANRHLDMADSPAHENARTNAHAVCRVFAHTYPLRDLELWYSVPVTHAVSHEDPSAHGHPMRRVFSYAHTLPYLELRHSISH